MPDTKPVRNDLLEFARNFMADITESASLVKLAGGSLNYVWRIQSSSGKTYIIKCAPPYVATKPEIALDSSRIVFEGRILRAFQVRSELKQLEEFKVRPPEFLGQDISRHLLLMEDVGQRPNLLQASRSADDNFTFYGINLGAWIADLHGLTYNNDWFADWFANLPVQQTRLQVQYNGCLECCQRGRVPDAGQIGAWCRELGEKLNSVGKCLVMGDLWPYSILPDRKEIRLIDWELTHFGRPAQDVAHLAAHLWMMHHRAGSQSQKDRIDSFRRSFVKSYIQRVAQHDPDLIDEEDERDFQIHFGAEILIRTLGKFQQNYLYDGLSPDHPLIQEAAAEARKWICGEYSAFRS